MHLDDQTTTRLRHVTVEGAKREGSASREHCTERYLRNDPVNTARDDLTSRRSCNVAALRIEDKEFNVPAALRGNR
jgi:protein subunit release factor B